MRRVALALTLASAAVLGVSGVSAAQPPPPTGPDTVACEQANAAVGIKADDAAAAAAELDRAVETLEGALRENVDAAQVRHQDALDAFSATPEQDAEERATKLAELVTAQSKLQQALQLMEDAAPPGPTLDALVAAQERLQVAIQARVSACAAPPPATTPPATTPPATTPPATTPPATTPPTDLDCADFPSGGAQAELDKTPGADPHGLDANGNRIACESGESDTTPPTQVTRVPTGGVDTGGEG